MPFAGRAICLSWIEAQKTNIRGREKTIDPMYSEGLMGKDLQAEQERTKRSTLQTYIRRHKLKE